MAQCCLVTNIVLEEINEEKKIRPKNSQQKVKLLNTPKKDYAFTR